jgi:uncharacterized protein YodC (DUF2158 family)
MKFAPGQIVNLKSGGQSKTVLAIDNNTVECIWLAEGGDFLRETIPARAIEYPFADDEFAIKDEHIEARADDDDDEDEEEDEEDGDEDEDDEDDEDDDEEDEDGEDEDEDGEDEEEDEDAEE